MSTDGAPSGFEVEIAREVAAELGREPRFAWVAPAAGAVERALLSARCDAMLGALAEPGTMAGGVRPGLSLTRPYYRAGYLLVRHPDARPVRALADIEDERIVVEASSIASFTLRQRGFNPHIVFDSDAVIRTVAEGGAPYGYLWGPLAGWRTRDRDDLVLASEFEPVDTWAFAMAVREEDQLLLKRLDAAMGRLVKRGTIAEIFERYSVPFLPARSTSRPGE